MFTSTVHTDSRRLKGDNASTSSDPLRIGVNVLFLVPGDVGGSEIYTRQLLQALAEVDEINHYYVFRNRETAADAIVPDAINFHDCPQRVNARFRPARIAYEQSALLIALAAHRIDILFNCGFTAPLLAWMPMATVFYDLQYKRFGHNLKRINLLINTMLLPASARRSASLIAMSEAVRADLLAYYPWSSGRITLVPHGVDQEFTRIRAIRAERPIEEKYILAVSALMVHKNFDTLLQAFAQFRRTHPDFRLIIAGIKGRDTMRLEDIRAALHLDTAVQFAGWIPRPELLNLFAHASAFVYASSFEGFGIPVLEALTAGIPTACSRIPPIEEIAGNAVRYFSPLDVSEIAEALQDIVDNKSLRARLSSDGPTRSQRFDSRTNATTLVAVLESLRTKRRNKRSC